MTPTADPSARGPRPATGGATARTAAPRGPAPRTTAPRTAAPRSAAPSTAAPRTADPRTAEPRTAPPRTAAPRPAPAAPRATPSARSAAGAPAPGTTAPRRAPRTPPSARSAAPRTGGSGGSGGRGGRGGPGGRPPAGAPSRPPLKVGDVDRRTALVLGLAVAVTGVFGVRLVQLQAVDSGDLAAEALDQRLTTNVLPAVRGSIFTSDGSPLAESVVRYDVVVDQTLTSPAYQRWTGPSGERTQVTETTADAAALIAPIIGQDPAAVAAVLTGEKRWTQLVRGITPDQWREVDALGIPGVDGVDVSERTYPAENTAGNIVGFVSSEGEGRAGLEMYLEDVLTGTDGEDVFERGASGQRIPLGEESSTAPVDGADVTLTVDRDLQWFAQQAIDAQVAAYQAQYGAVSVIDPKTGFVLALAESGTVNPNDPGATAPETWGNRSLSDSNEPGSTAKVITAAAAIEEGLVSPSTRMTIPYAYTTSNGETFHDSHVHPDEQLTFAGVLAQSSNTGTVMVGEQLSEQQRFDYLTAFGIGQKTGIESPSESRGQFKPFEEWDGRTEYTVLFGQGFAATMLQQAQVFATIANGGVRMPPHLVAGITDPDGTTTPTPTSEGVRVVSQETADQVRSMLEGAVGDGGTGSSAAVPGFRVAGKTGTAQLAGPGGYAGNGYVGSFIGMAPAEDPEFVVAVSLFKPEVAYYGGTVAAPVFSDVMAYALQQRGVAPSGAEPDLVPLTW